MNIVVPFVTLVSGADYELEGSLENLVAQVPCIEDLAHSLSIMSRYNGATLRPYSVAEHSILVADIVRAMGASAAVQLAALLHDAHEAITGDVITPTKKVLGDCYNRFESLHARVFAERFGIVQVLEEEGVLIKTADLIARATERRDLMRRIQGVSRPWPKIDDKMPGVEPISSVDLMSGTRAALPWCFHRDQFIRRFSDLSQQGSRANTARGLCLA